MNRLSVVRRVSAAPSTLAPSTLGLAALAMASLSACSTRPTTLAVAPAPPPPVAIAAAMPAGGMPGMTIPARLADGRYPTPSHAPGGGALTPEATVWHLRAALNVAALACRGQGDALVTGYNAMLTTRRAAFGAAEARYAAEWKASGIADWQDGYDDAMTRLYNFYGQSFARPGFCAAAAATLAAMAPLPDADLPTFATQHLAALDRPFTDFFAAYDAWRGDAIVQRPIIALMAPTAAPVSVAPAPAVTPAATAPPAKPRLEVDPAIFRLP